MAKQSKAAQARAAAAKAKAEAEAEIAAQEAGQPAETSTDAVVADSAPKTEVKPLPNTYAVILSHEVPTQDLLVLADYCGLLAESHYIGRFNSTAEAVMCIGGIHEALGKEEGDKRYGVYLPRPDFDDRRIESLDLHIPVTEVSAKAMAVAEQATNTASAGGSAWNAVKPGVRPIRANDIQIVLGSNLRKPADFVLMHYDPELGRNYSCETILHMCEKDGIEVRNLADEATRNLVLADLDARQNAEETSTF